MNNDQSETVPSARNQYIVASIVSLFTMTYGITIGWPSASMLVLMSDQSPLESGKITIDEISWIASLASFGGLISNICCGWITKRFGRQMPLLFFSIPAFLSWVLILNAKNVHTLYVARFLNGLDGGANSVVTPLYLSEVASARNRGVIGSSLVLSVNFGIILAFVLGYYCDYHTTPKFVLLLLFVFTLLFAFVPDTPAFLVKQNKLSEAKKSIRFYHNLQRGKISDNEILQRELKMLKKTCENVDKLVNSKNENHFKWSDLNTKVALKAMLIGIVLAVLNQCSGVFAMANYAAFIFKEAGTTMSPNESAIVVGMIQFVGIAIAMNLVDRAGRKCLYMISTLGMAFGFVTFGIYMKLKTLDYNVETFGWIPLASFSLILFIGSWAVSSLPYVITAEIMPQSLKEFGVSVCMSLIWILAFVMVKFTPFLNETLNLHGCMFLFAGVCISGAIFICFCVPETRAKTLEEIMDSLR